MRNNTDDFVLCVTDKHLPKILTGMETFHNGGGVNEISATQGTQQMGIQFTDAQAGPFLLRHGAQLGDLKHTPTLRSRHLDNGPYEMPHVTIAQSAQHAGHNTLTRLKPLPPSSPSTSCMQKISTKAKLLLATMYTAPLTDKNRFKMSTCGTRKDSFLSPPPLLPLSLPLQQCHYIIIYTGERQKNTGTERIGERQRGRNIKVQHARYQQRYTTGAIKPRLAWTCP